jgi:hypothetical protein
MTLSYNETTQKNWKRITADRFRAAARDYCGPEGPATRRRVHGSTTRTPGSVRDEFKVVVLVVDYSPVERLCILDGCFCRIASPAGSEVIIGETAGDNVEQVLTRLDGFRIHCSQKDRALKLYS